MAINTAKAEVEKFVLDHLAAFEAGDLDRWGAGMTDDIFMIAADPAEAIAGRAAILTELHKDFDPAFGAGLKLSIKPTFNSIGVSKDLNTAWTAHVLAYTIMFGADTIKFTLRNTNVLIKQNDRWRIVAANYSRPISQPEMKEKGDWKLTQAHISVGVPDA
ncbi:MAG: nuclear transport factor 2 family protein [bacterium]